MVDRKINWLKLILAFLIATAIFFFGLFVGYLAKNLISSSTIDIESSTRNTITNLETLNLLEGSYPCNTAVIDTVSQKLDYLGSIITTLENKKGKFDSDVLELKKLYTDIEIRHALLVQSRDAKCGQVHNIILFFYSNTAECKAQVDKTAFIADYMRNKYDNVKVYSFDSDLNSDVVSVLKNQYKIAGCSGIVLNDKKIENVTNSQQLENVIKK